MRLLRLRSAATTDAVVAVTLWETPHVPEKKGYKAPRVRRREKLAKVAESTQPVVTDLPPTGG